MDNYTRPSWMTDAFCALLDTVIAEVCHETGRQPTADEIASLMNEDTETIEAALQAMDILVSEGSW